MKNNKIEYIMKQEETINVVISNAGYGIVGVIEDCSVDEFKQPSERWNNPCPG